MRFHTNLPVNDITETVAFYSVLFDTAPVKTKVDYAKFLPPQGGLNISFHQSSGGAEQLRGLHLGLELADPTVLDQAHQRLQEAGFISVERETAVCCYALQDKFWVTDPNGYEWELYYLVEDTEEKISPQLDCCVPDGESGELAASGAKPSKVAKAGCAAPEEKVTVAATSCC